MNSDHRIYFPIADSRDKDPWCALVVSVSSLRDTRRAKILADWILSDGRDSYCLIVVNGAILDVPKDVFNATLSRDGSIGYVRLDTKRDYLILRTMASHNKKVFVDCDIGCENVSSIFDFKSNGTPVGHFRLTRRGVLFGCNETKCVVPAENLKWYQALSAFKRAVGKAIEKANAKEVEIVPLWVRLRAQEFKYSLLNDGMTPKEKIESLLKDRSDDQQLVSCLEVLLNALIGAAKELKVKIDLNQERIIEGVFGSKQTIEAHLCCIIDFVKWLISMVWLGAKVDNLIEDFLFDLSMFNQSHKTNAIGAIYGNSIMGRCARPVDMLRHFEASQKLVLTHTIDYGLSAQTLGITGLRQSLENRYKSLVGLCDTNAHLHHNCVPGAIRAYEKELRFSNRTVFSLGCLWQIYEWTNNTVHTTYVDLIWKGWKAFDYANLFFRPSRRWMKGGALSIHSAVHMDVATVHKIRECIKSSACEEEQKKKQRAEKLVFAWCKPEVVIDDDQGEQWSRVEEVEIKRNKQHISEINAIISFFKRLFCFCHAINDMIL